MPEPTLCFSQPENGPKVSHQILKGHSHITYFGPATEGWSCPRNQSFIITLSSSVFVLHEMDVGSCFRHLKRRGHWTVYLVGFEFLLNGAEDLALRASGTSGSYTCLPYWMISKYCCPKYLRNRLHPNPDLIMKRYPKCHRRIVFLPAWSHRIHSLFVFIKTRKTHEW